MIAEKQNKRYHYNLDSRAQELSVSNGSWNYLLIEGTNEAAAPFLSAMWWAQTDDYTGTHPRAMAQSWMRIMDCTGEKGKA